jgi:hypothetical protein
VLLSRVGGVAAADRGAVRRSPWWIFCARSEGEIMVNNNLNVILNSTVPLNSINYKSNQHRESFPSEYSKIQLKML